MSSQPLPLPRLERRESDERASSAVAYLTDDALFERTGTRIGFTERIGGSSTGALEELDLKAGMDEQPGAGMANLMRLDIAVDLGLATLIRPNQVHGAHIVEVANASPEAVEAARAEAKQGADAVLVTAREGSALLCFADCLPLVLVAPSGAFAVVHAGWRGAVERIASKAARALAAAEAAMGPHGSAEQAAGQINAYIGPYIHSECFECGPEVRDRFAATFGAGCIPDDAHVDLGAAVAADLAGAGIAAERIADAGLCTACHTDRFFSYRASGGHTGRHGAFAVRKEAR